MGTPTNSWQQHRAGQHQLYPSKCTASLQLIFIQRKWSISKFTSFYQMDVPLQFYLNSLYKFKYFVICMDALPLSYEIWLPCYFTVWIWMGQFRPNLVEQYIAEIQILKDTEKQIKFELLIFLAGWKFISRAGHHLTRPWKCIFRPYVRQRTGPKWECETAKSSESCVMKISRYKWIAEE